MIGFCLDPFTTFCLVAAVVLTALMLVRHSRRRRKSRESAGIWVTTTSSRNLTEAERRAISVAEFDMANTPRHFQQYELQLVQAADVHQCSRCGVTAEMPVKDCTLFRNGKTYKEVYLCDGCSQLFLSGSAAFFRVDWSCEKRGSK